ncbi:MAG: hypothetical protein OXF06_14500 [Bacteroidetes bacterium]|nr:hypothetical protein [Bacteroidota bacterium]MCY4226027.1 hypothetical protein [Bacteroidota bacterium]
MLTLILVNVFTVLVVIVSAIFIYKRASVQRERRLDSMHFTLHRKVTKLQRRYDKMMDKLRYEFQAKMALMEKRLQYIQDNVDSMQGEMIYRPKVHTNETLMFDRQILRLHGFSKFHSDGHKSKVDHVIHATSSTVSQSLREGFNLSVNAEEPPVLEMTGSDYVGEVSPDTSHMTSPSYNVRYTVPRQFAAHNWLITDSPHGHETLSHPFHHLNFTSEVLK